MSKQIHGVGKVILHLNDGVETYRLKGISHKTSDNETIEIFDLANFLNGNALTLRVD